jgi:hypothetical protein
MLRLRFLRRDRSQGRSGSVGRNGGDRRQHALSCLQGTCYCPLILVFPFGLFLCLLYLSNELVIKVD